VPQVFLELLVPRVHRVLPVTRAILELQASLVWLDSRETQVRPGMLDLRDSVVMLDQSVQ
jgi:predicted 2-oxoglutarate/Fe(II)-dependent dioxygenase YbiX